MSFIINNKQYTVEFWNLSTIIRGIINQLGTNEYKDDVMRTLQLVKYAF